MFQAVFASGSAETKTSRTGKTNFEPSGDQSTFPMVTGRELEPLHLMALVVHDIDRAVAKGWILRIEVSHAYESDLCAVRRPLRSDIVDGDIIRQTRPAVALEG